METIPKNSADFGLRNFFVRIYSAISKSDASASKFCHLLILPEAQKVNAPDREKEMRKKKFPALGGRRALRAQGAPSAVFFKGVREWMERIAQKSERRRSCWDFLPPPPIAMPSAQAADRTVSELIPVGQTVGVKLFSDGVLVVGFSDGESPAKDCGLKEGDVITAIGGQSLDTIEEFRQLLAENGEDAAALTVKRGSRTIELSAEPEKDEDGEYRLGAWVRDSMAGIGTMTFFDPQSGTFGALGHGVTDVDTGQLLPLDHGSIMDASVKAVKKGERASPGELKGDFDLTRDSGTLYANTECGIFGKLSAEDAAKITGAALPIAKKDEIKTGRAAILATVFGNETREYDIEIEKIYSPSGSTRNLLLRVTDEELLAQTGGVVQGMSGSAILQDGKIIGAVTHVLLDDPSRGYGIFIENMLSAAGLSSE